MILDGGQSQDFSGFSTTNLFQQTLFAAIDLADVTHTIVGCAAHKCRQRLTLVGNALSQVIQNLGAQGQTSTTATVLDIDAIIVTESIPAGQTIKSNVVDDADLKYSGLGWTTDFGAQTAYFSKTGQ